MQIPPIQTEVEHDAAVARIAQLMGAKLGTPESDELDVLASVVDAYESVHFPMDEPDPEFLRRFELEQRGDPE